MAAVRQGGIIQPTTSIRRFPFCPLRFRRFHPPRQIVGETRKTVLKGLATLTDRLTGGGQGLRDLANRNRA